MTANAGHAAVRAEGVWKVFNEGQQNEVTALQDVSLEVGEGEFVSLIGPSGCGKSTLLRVIADLTHATRGELTVAGLTPAQAREEQKYGMAFQQASLLPSALPAFARVSLNAGLHHAEPARRAPVRGT